MTSQRTIKKYPNRRLYDTAISSYITLQDVRRLVVDNEPFVVVDSRSGEEITRTILLQIIAEQEEQGEPLFSSEVLAGIIRGRGHPQSDSLADFLRQSLALFNEQQQRLARQVEPLLGDDPVAAMAELTRRNLEIWSAVQRQFLREVTEPRDDRKPSD